MKYKSIDDDLVHVGALKGRVGERGIEEARTDEVSAVEIAASHLRLLEAHAAIQMIGRYNRNNLIEGINKKMKSELVNTSLILWHSYG